MSTNPPMTGACDCHVHVVGPVERYPQKAGRSFTAMPATLDRLQAAAAPLGVDHFVITQASFYGTDNRCLLDALGKLGERGRGVAVVDVETTTPDLLRDFGRRGVRGLRANTYSKSSDHGPQGLAEVLKKTAKILPDAGWHVEIVAPLKGLVAAAEAIERAGVTIVLDHYGVPGNASPESDPGRVLLHLASLPHVWVKLSASYRSGNDPLATAPLADWLPAFLRVARERCVWASDWPHTPLAKDQTGTDVMVPYRKIEYARLFTEFCEALPEPGLAAQILKANPRRLYGFPPES